jgi:hypothetical protein
VLEPYTPPVAGKRGDTLLNMMLFIEMFTLNWAWTDLSDSEFFWEPVPGCWSARRRAECLTPTPFGKEDWVADFDSDLAATSIPGRSTEPLTTIAWLMWHVGSMPGRTAELDFLGGAKSAESGWTSPYLANHPVFASATEAVETMRAGWRSLDEAIRASTDDQLEQRTRFWGYGQAGPPASGYQIVALMLNEISHHGTQVCMLRDLYRAVDGAALSEARH